MGSLAESVVLLRPIRREDRDPIAALISANRPVFSEVEVKTAIEVLDEAIDPPPDDPDPYLSLVAEEEGKVLGFVFYGTVPLTEGTYDLYWIAVDPEKHGSGVGSRLVGGVEASVRGRGGHLIVVETSSREDYAKTRAFYERSGYERACVLRDFYKRGDDKVLYVKRVTG
jgi:ribosomal protein S18 acetylase RimI-like enzyme